MCFACIYLFVFACVSLFSLPLGVEGWLRLAAVCDCGTLWTFLLTFMAQNLQNGQCSQDHVAHHRCSVTQITSHSQCKHQFY